MIIDSMNELFADAGFPLTPQQSDTFDLYTDLLLEWNEKINLTAIIEPREIALKHFLDSVLPLKMAEIPQGARVIDVGTGAGFPSIPMKIMRPDIRLTLLDSLNKRIKFLAEVSTRLSLDAVCVHSRAEDGARRANLRESFDVATARAVAALPTLCEYCLPYLKIGGIFLALKGPGEDVLAAKSSIFLLGGKLLEEKRYMLPNWDERLLIVIKKVAGTSAKYPRNSAAIAKKPL